MRAFSPQSQKHNTLKHTKYIVSPLRFFLLLAVPFLFSVSSAWAITSSYYSSLDGKSAKNLFDAIHTVSKTGYSGLTYAQLWTAYCAIDINSSGKVWDMYSNTTSYTCGGSAQGANYSKEGDSYNREHSIPKSWFGGSTSSGTPGTDLFHVVPTDGYVNNMRSAFAFGEVSSATYTSNSGCKKGTAKSITISNTILATSGSSTQSCSATVFEPMDEYKGDFARGYFGSMVMWANGDYQTFTTDEGATMFNTAYDAAHYYGLTAYGVALLMKWHREDPVSQKEIDRNNGIQNQQGNRNPFIDYPCLAEYLWGNKTGETFNLSDVVGSFESGFTPGVSDGCACSTDPTLTINPTSLTVDPVAVNGTSTKTFTVTGANLTGNITITKTSGSGYFTVSPSSIAAASANGTNTITVTYHPTATGDHTATFTIASTGATSKTVTVSGTCTTVHTATWMANGSQYHQNTAADGSAPSVPEAPDDCGDDRVFMGWTDNENYSGSGSGLYTDEAPTMNTDKTFYAVYADKETSGGGGSSSSASYTFSDKSWAASPSNWTSGKDGNGFSNSGVQVTTGVSGANATCPTSYNSISSIVISYCTNASKGAGSIQMTVGSTSVSNNVSTSGGTTARDLTFDFSSTKPSGAPQITVTCTTNSIYICGVTITYGGGGSTTYSNYSTQCTACTPVAATASYAYPTRTTTCGGTVTNNFTTNSTATVSYTSSNTSVATVASDGTVTPVGAGTTTITATVPANTCFTGGASASFSLTVNRNTGTASFNTPTTTVNKGATVTNVVTTNSDGAVTYSSSNTSVATVNASGVVTGVGVGTAIITANVAQSTCYTATTANYTITVYDFKANDATDVTCESFTANWNTSGAASYSLDVYQGTTGSTTVSRDTTFYTKDFTSNISNWTISNVSGYENVWSHNYSSACATSYVSKTRYAAESWLISPSIDLSDATDVTLTLNHVFRYSSTVSVKISTDDGSSWSAITLSPWSSASSWTYGNSTVDLSSYAGQTIKLALVYIGTTDACPTWQVATCTVSGKYDKTISTSSVEHVSGYPKNVTGTSASVTTLDPTTTYYYTVTPSGGSVSNQIEVTTPACSCTYTITATTDDSSQGTVSVTTP